MQSFESIVYRYNVYYFRQATRDTESQDDTASVSEDGANRRQEIPSVGQFCNLNIFEQTYVLTKFISVKFIFIDIDIDMYY